MGREPGPPRLLSRDAQPPSTVGGFARIDYLSRLGPVIRPVHRFSSNPLRASLARHILRPVPVRSVFRSDWRVGNSGREQPKSGRWVGALLVYGAILAGIVTVILTGMHWLKGAPVGDAIRMSINDWKVATKCPTHKDNVIEFIGRSEWESAVLGASIGPEVWVQKVCDAGRRR